MAGIPDPRKPYDVEIGGMTHRVLLTEQDAARYGQAAVVVVETKKVEPANKARRPRANKAPTPTPGEVAEQPTAQPEQ